MLKIASLNSEYTGKFIKNRLRTIEAENS